MSDQELLGAISQMLDEKLDKMLDEKLDKMLDEKLDKILDQKLDEKLDKMLDEKLDKILDQKLDKKLDKIFDARLKPIEEEIASLKRCFMSLDARLQRVEDFQRDVILPRLNTIESCYLDTYERYVKATERMESAYDDVQLLKKVVEKHSQEIQELQQAVGS